MRAQARKHLQEAHKAALLTRPTAGRLMAGEVWSEDPSLDCAHKLLLDFARRGTKWRPRCRTSPAVQVPDGARDLGQVVMRVRHVHVARHDRQVHHGRQRARPIPS